ncbi:Crp/Fnr family transcriptional regulator [Magnetovibrio blakemorei]|nr:cyclic nucleotide-binding domain-containing protein [Magnetovibrio blakemorei]
MESHTYHIGDIIFQEGDHGDCAYLIKSGQVKITKIARDDQPRTIATLNAGNILGEMALIDNEPRAASAVVLQDTEVLIISNEEFQKRLDGSDPVIGLLMQTFTNRLRQQAQQLVRMMS